MVDEPLQLKSACLTASEIAELEKATETTEGLPARAYIDPQLYELERHTLFRNGWVAAAFAQDLSNPGDVFLVTIAGWELVFARK